MSFEAKFKILVTLGVLLMTLQSCKLEHPPKNTPDIESKYNKQDIVYIMGEYPAVIERIFTNEWCPSKVEYLVKFKGKEGIFSQDYFCENALKSK